MRKIAVILRALQLFAHNAHNLAKGHVFFQDHSQFGELYGVYEEEYDDVIERIIMFDGECDLGAVNLEAAKLVSSVKADDNENSYQVILKTEESLQEALAEAMPDASYGTQNLLQGIADKSEHRMYKFKRRLIKA
jgi:DNA-binding ferritin-like protein